MAETRGGLAASYELQQWQLPHGADAVWCLQPRRLQPAVPERGLERHERDGASRRPPCSERCCSSDTRGRQQKVALSDECVGSAGGGKCVNGYAKTH